MVDLGVAVVLYVATVLGVLALGALHDAARSWRAQTGVTPGGRGGESTHHEGANDA